MDFSSPHRRWNPLKEEWVLVSPHRAKRPWQGAVERAPAANLPKHEPTCYLCPGNKRSNNDTNPDYKDVYIFDNDFSALLQSESENGGGSKEDLHGIIKASHEQGICRVICFTPRHDLTLAEMPPSHIEKVIEHWGIEYKRLASLAHIGHVMIFENKGSIMGCSNPHPHGQIWATESIPNIPKRSAEAQKNYYAAHSSNLLIDYLNWEVNQKERIISENEHFVSLVPFWAVWPYETMILPRRAAAKIEDLSKNELSAWAAMISELTARYDNIFECSFPYSMGVYQAPTNGNEWPGFTLHQIFLPPLLRSATVKKFMVGFEMCGEPQRDITPEQAAATIRACSSQHYKTR